MSQKNVNDIVLMVKYNFTFVLLKSGQNTMPPSSRPVTYLWSRAESFYYVNYGLSIIMSKTSQIISVMKK